MGFKVCEKFKGTQLQLGRWKKTTKPNSKRHIEELRDDIRKGLVDEKVRQKYIREKKKQLVITLKEEEVYRKTKSRNTWLREGDKNTKFFHAQMVQWRRSNSLQGLEDNHGVWHTKSVRMQEIVVDYFITLFRSGGSWSKGEVAACVGGKVEGRQNGELTQHFSAKEIREAVFQNPATKSPGPNGFTVAFFQDHWEMVGDDIIRMVQAFYHSGRLLQKINHTHIVLI